MAKKLKNTPSTSTIRKNAEALIRGKTIDTTNMANDDIQHLLHELQVHQIELELQNEELRQTQQQLEVSYDRYVQLFDFAPNGYMICDSYGIIKEANLTLCQLLGIERNQLLGKSLAMFITSERQDDYFLYRQKILKSNTSISCELEIVDARNNHKTVQLESIRLINLDNNEKNYQTSVSDVTELRKAAAILENENRLRQLVGAASEGILLVDESGIIKMSNESSEKLFGYRENELTGKRIDQLIPKSLRNLLEHDGSVFLNQLGNDTNSGFTELVGLKKSGEKFSADISISSFMINDALYTTVFVTDITERKLAEDALRKEKETAQLYLDLANSIFVVLDTHQNVVLINRKGCEVLGYEEDEIKGKNWFENFIPAKSRENLIEAHNKIMNQAIDLKEVYENEIITKNNKLRMIGWHNAVLTNNQGEVIGTISSGIDLTKRKRAEAALLNAIHQGQEDERKRISADLHDGLGQHLIGSKMLFGALDDEIQNLSENARNYYQKAMKTLNNGITEARNISHNLVPQELQERGIVYAIKKFCSTYNLNKDLKIDIQSNDFHTRQDPQTELGIYRIVQELIGNVLKHANASLIKINLEQREETFLLTVEDNGIGYDSGLNIMKKTGLGLKNINSRVKGLQGDLSIKSLKQKGTCVEINIPLVK